ncbi:MAG TPA: exodeoxyribonuclease III [Alphaproteobacteria bacterium]|nr:exodeoxyribonuclease III [Alphaproteobacteria bacterium]USO05796.1 MAG: exodeoxyribonuclease III [Rhodospirillales bacterium]HOO82821.1 exodeoxyribonuclease III [Alphaproteobacteria bacterium]
MKIASWNVNSLKARRAHVENYLASSGLDVLMVQELKGLDFPHEDFEKLGWHTAAVTQKTYNGVAIFSKTPVKVIKDALPGDKDDEQARYLEFETGGIRLIDIYLPNGNPVGTEKFTYKLDWIERLYKRLKTLREDNIPFAIGGDFNVIPEDKDCYDPKKWMDDALFQPESRAAFRKLLHLGLTEAFRAMHNGAGHYTFWDYQAGAWPKNHGIRIDHFLLSPELADRLINCTIDKALRALDKPSDHTPIIIEIES